MVTISQPMRGRTAWFIHTKAIELNAGDLFQSTPERGFNLQTVSFFNPLTYVVDALRYFMLAGSTTNLGLIQDFAVMLVTTVGLFSSEPACIREWGLAPE
jgi:hypothetical protein